jgi:(p)ppGpp synthase/HD superfamily hydrolase
MLTDRFVEAVDYAVELHRTQVRKATSIPYVTHLFAVQARDRRALFPAS